MVAAEPREPLLEAGLALAHTIDVDRALHEASQQLRRLLACDAVAIALAEGHTAALRLAYHFGFTEDAQTLAHRLMPAWLESTAGHGVHAEHAPDGMEHTAPLIGDTGVVGALTVALPTPSLTPELEHALTTLAAEIAAAVERCWLVLRVQEKRRLDTMGEVSAGVARELRGPLFGISSAAQLLRFRVKDDPVVEKNVGRILREVERLNGLVTALHEYGRPSPIHLAAGDPDAVWDDVLGDQRGLLESRALLLRRTRPSPSARCAIDAPQLGQVLLHLLTNAADAAPEGTDLTLGSTVLADGSWHCRLHNAGTAIPAEVLPRVFEIFFSTKPGSAGIGLALCRRIIEEHGGTLVLESAPEQGTSATIHLPAA